MNLQKLVENLCGIQRPMGLLELQNRGFENTYETIIGSRIQIYRRDDYTVLYDMEEREVVSVLKDKKDGAY